MVFQIGEHAPSLKPTVQRPRRASSARSNTKQPEAVPAVGCQVNQPNGRGAMNRKWRPASRSFEKGQRRASFLSGNDLPSIFVTRGPCFLLFAGLNLNRSGKSGPEGEAMQEQPSSKLPGSARLGGCHVASLALRRWHNPGQMCITIHPTVASDDDLHLAYFGSPPV